MSVTRENAIVPSATAYDDAFAVEPTTARPPEKDEAPKRVARITWASDIVAERAAWLEEPHIPLGELTLAAGREGTGKSSYAIRTASHTTRGTLRGDYWGYPRTVLYVATEDSWAHTIRPRLEAAGADLGLVARLDVLLDGDERREAALSLPDDLPAIEDMVRTHHVALIVFDPLVSAMEGKRDADRQRDVRAVLEPLVRMAHNTGSAIIGIAHFHKGQGDPASLLSGSHAWKDVARSVLVFAHDTTNPGGERVMQQVKNSLGPLQDHGVGYVIVEDVVQSPVGELHVSRFEFTGARAEHTVAEVMAQNSHGPDLEGDEVAEWLRGFLSAQEGCSAAVKALQVATREAGFSWDQAKRAKGRIPGYVVRSMAAAGGAARSGWLWVLEPVLEQEHK